MAKKRLNKKLLVILSLAGMTIIVLMAVVVIDYRSMRNPELYLQRGRELIEEGRALDASLKGQVAAEQDVGRRYSRLWELEAEEGLAQKWEQAKEALRRAANYAKGDVELRREALEELSELSLATGDYESAVGIWHMMLQEDSRNEYAQGKLTDYYYELAQYGRPDQWPEVLVQADKLIALQPEEALGYNIKAQGLIILAEDWGAKDPDEARWSSAWDYAEHLLNEARRREDKDVLAYKLQALLKRRRAQESADKGEQEELRGQSEQYLREAVAQNPDDVEAYLNLFGGHLYPLAVERYNRVEAEAEDLAREKLRREAEEALEAVLGELDQVRERFGEEGRIYEAKGQLREIRVQGLAELDEEIGYYEQALSCDDSQSRWYQKLAELYELRSNYVDIDNMALIKADREKAYRLLSWGLSVPELYKIDRRASKYGLWQGTRLIMLEQQIALSGWLAEGAETEDVRADYIEAGEQACRELKETRGAEDPRVQFAEGVLALARGDWGAGLKSLYRADMRLRAAGQINIRLKKKLFYTLRGTEYQSLGLNYIQELLNGQFYVDPKTLIDYIEAAAETVGERELPFLQGLIGSYETAYGERVPFPDHLQAIKAEILIRLEELAAAREILAGISQESKEIRILRARAQETRQERIEALAEIVREAPGDAELVPMLFYAYLATGQAESPPFDQARALISGALGADPQNINFLQMQGILQEPDPNNISSARMEAITLEVLQGIEDGYRRAMELGYFYQQMAIRAQMGGQAEPNNTYWRRAGENYRSAFGQADDLEALKGMFDASWALGDEAGAKDVIAKLRGKDRYLALLYEGIFSAYKGRWEEVIAPLTEYLQERPISSRGYQLLAEAYFNAGRLDDAISAAQTAVNQNPNDAAASRLLALLLHRRHQGAPENISDLQVGEMMVLLERANLGFQGDPSVCDLQLVYYPRWISISLEVLEQQVELGQEEKAERRRLILQKYEEADASLGELLGRDDSQEVRWIQRAGLREQYSDLVIDEARQAALRELVEGIYREALGANPHSALLAGAYSQYLLRRGQSVQAEKMLIDKIVQAGAAEKGPLQIRLSQFYYYQLGEVEKAQQVLREILAEAPHHREGMILLAQMLAEQGDYEEALKLYEDIRAAGDDEELAARHVEILLRAGFLDRAEQLLAEMSKNYPGSINKELLAGRLALRRTSYSAARAHADIILRENPNNVTALLLKGEALYYDQKLTDALASLEQLRRLVPRENNLGREVLARVYWGLGRRDDAIRELRAGLEAAPGNMQLLQELMTWLRLTNRWGDMEQFYTEALARYPEIAVWYALAAEAAAQRGDYELQSNRPNQAAQQYRKALKLLEMGQDLSLKQGKTELAEQALAGRLGILRKLEEYRQILELVGGNLRGEPSDGALLAYRAAALYGLQRNQEALAAYEEAFKAAGGDVQLINQVIMNAALAGEAKELIIWARGKVNEQPGRIPIYLLLAHLYQGQGDGEQEIAALREARGRAEEDWILWIEQQLALAYGRAMQNDKAIEYYRLVLIRDPDNVTALNNLAYALLAQEGQEDEAAAFARQAYNLARTNPNIMDTYAVALMGQKDFKQAESVIRRAIQELQRTGQEVSAEFYYHLGQALVGLNRTEEAATEMKRALLLLSGENRSPQEVLLRQEIEAALKEISKGR